MPLTPKKRSSHRLRGLRHKALGPQNVIKRSIRSISAAVAARAVIGSAVVLPGTKTSAVRSVILFKCGVRFMRVFGLLGSNGRLTDLAHSLRRPELAIRRNLKFPTS